MSDGKMQYQLGLGGGSAFAAGLNAARQQAMGLAGTLGGSLKGALAGVGALLGVGASLGGFAAGVKSALDLGGTLSDLSAQTGQAVADLVVLRQAFNDAGLGADSVGPMINVLQKSLAGVNEAGEPTNKTFEKLGLNMDALKNADAKTQLDTIGKALQAIQNPAERAQTAMQIFGKSGGKMLALLNDSGAMKSAADTVGGQAKLLEKNAALFDRVSDLLGAVGSKVGGFFVGVADRVAPLLLPLLERLNQIDLSGIGQQIGNIFTVVSKAFADGKLGELIGLSLKVGFMQAVDFFAGALAGTVTMFAGALVPAVAAVARLLTDPKLWTGMAAGMEGAVAKFGAAFLACFREPLSWLSATFEWIAQKFGAALVALWNPIAKGIGATQLEVKDNCSFDQMRKDYMAQSKDTEGKFNAIGKNDMKAAGGDLGDAIAARMGEVKSIIGAAFDNFKSGSGNLSIFGDAKNAATAQLNALFAQLVPKAVAGAAPGSLAGKGADAAGGGTDRKAQVDPWAKIGFNIGGNGNNAATKAAEKTARHSENMERHLQIIATKLGNTSAISIATYA